MKKLIIICSIFLVFLLACITSVNAINIDGCGVLDREGEYVLTRNIIDAGNDECMGILVSNIVLDCQGHTIDGGIESGTGVYVYNPNRNERLTNIIIRNCEIKEWRSGGVVFATASDSLLEDSEIHSNNGHGIDLFEVENVIIRNNDIHDNGNFGIMSSFSNSNTITANTINNNRGDGIYLSASDSNTITDNIITGNRLEDLENGEGIYMIISHSNTISRNIMSNNDESGIRLVRSRSNTITDNYIENNDESGIYLRNIPDLNNIISNRFCYNGEADITVEDIEDNVFLYNQCNNIRGDDNIECMPCDVELEEHNIELNEGWNLISSYLVPYFDEIDAIFGKLARKGDLIMVKDERGRFYIPDRNFNNIPQWNPNQAYQVKVNENTSLTIKGEEYVAPVIQLHEGWNFVSYPLNYSRNMNDIIENVLSELGNNLEMMKNNRGNFYNPEWNFSNIREMRPGEGYQIKVRQDVEINFSN